MSSVEEILPMLQGVTLFEGLSPEDLRRIAAIGEERSAEEGELLFEEGEEGNAFFLVISGAVEILRDRADGSRERLAVRRTGDAFGEMALLDDAPRSATARVQKEARLLVLSRDAFREVLDPDSPAFRMLGSLSRSLRALDVRFTAGQRQMARQDGIPELNRLIRQGLLPTRVPLVSGYEAAAGTSVKEDGEGATSWDVFSLSGGQPVFGLYHAAGGGFPPAQTLSVFRGVLRALARTASTLEGLLSEANEVMSDLAVPGAQPSVEQSVECALLSPGKEGVVWAGAGRPPGIVVRAGGGREPLPAFGPPLGMMEGFRYGARKLVLSGGDAVLALSEGTPGLVEGAGDLAHRLRERTVDEVVGTLHQAFERAEGAPAEVSVVLLRRV